MLFFKWSLHFNSNWKIQLHARMRIWNAKYGTLVHGLILSIYLHFYHKHVLHGTVVKVCFYPKLRYPSTELRLVMQIEEQNLLANGINTVLLLRQRLQGNKKEYFSLTGNKLQVHSNFLYICIKSHLGWASLTNL